MSDIRILAVQGAPTYAAPGEAISLHALTVDPRGRKLSIAWTTCLNPSSTVVNACFEKLAEDAQAGHPPTIDVGDGKSDYPVVIPTDALTSLPKAAAANAMMGVVTVACPGTISFATAASGGSLPVTCTGADGQQVPPAGFVISVKRITIREHDRNANPAIASVTWNGAPWPEEEKREVAPCTNDPVQFTDCTGGDQPSIAVTPAADAQEVGTDEFGTTFSEQLIVQNYGTEGAFEFDVRRGASPGGKWVARHAASGTDQTLWFVLHDDRGGVSWTTRTVHVR